MVFEREINRNPGLSYSPASRNSQPSGLEPSPSNRFLLLTLQTDPGGQLRIWGEHLCVCITLVILQETQARSFKQEGSWPTPGLHKRQHVLTLFHSSTLKITGKMFGEHVYSVAVDPSAKSLAFCGFKFQAEQEACLCWKPPARHAVQSEPFIWNNSSFETC